MTSDLKVLSNKFCALAATARIANVPSVVGNVFLGIALATGFGHGRFDGESFVVSITLLVFSGICLYLAGNFLNDWADLQWDVVHRPERALPQGFFTPLAYVLVACSFVLLGLCAAAVVGPQSLAVALSIVVCILIYTWIHKRSVWSVIPMGFCRALLPLMGFTGFAVLGGFAVALFASAFGLFCHIAGLSLSARVESMQSAPVGPLRFARWLFPLAALSMFFASRQGPACSILSSLSGLLPYGLWIVLCLTVFRKPVHALVSNLLAGIPLVDAIVLLPLAVSSALVGPFSVACLIVPMLAFFSGKALQRLAPAT